MSQGVDPHSTLMDHAAGDSHHCAVALHIADDHGSSADAGVRADRNRTQNLRSGSHHNVLCEGWVAFAVFLAGAAQGDALVKKTMVADFGSFADHYPHAMVNEDAVADASAGVDLDAG